MNPSRQPMLYEALKAQVIRRCQIGQRTLRAMVVESCALDALCISKTHAVIDTQLLKPKLCGVQTRSPMFGHISYHLL